MKTNTCCFTGHRILSKNQIHIIETQFTDFLGTFSFESLKDTEAEKTKTNKAANTAFFINH